MVMINIKTGRFVHMYTISYTMYLNYLIPLLKDQYAFVHHAIVHTLALDSKPIPTEGFSAYLSESENKQRQTKQFKVCLF